MRLSSFVLAAVIVASLSTAAMAELPNYYRNRGAIDRIRITTTEGTVLPIAHANIGDGVIDGDSVQVPFTSVRKLECTSGTKAKKGSTWGAIIGCAIGTGVSISTMETKTTDVGYGQLEETTIQTWPIYLFGLIGTVAGGAIGASSPAYSVVYQDGQKEKTQKKDSGIFSSMPEARLQPMLVQATREGVASYQLALSYRF